jgi:hypothetical protein
LVERIANRPAPVEVTTDTADFKRIDGPLSWTHHHPGTKQQIPVSGPRNARRVLLITLGVIAGKRGGNVKSLTWQSFDDDCFG